MNVEGENKVKTILIIIQPLIVWEKTGGLVKINKINKQMIMETKGKVQDRCTLNSVYYTEIKKKEWIGVDTMR